MSITSLFYKLGAPLANSRWSWGGIDQKSNRLFLRAWQDQTLQRNKKRFVRLAHHEAYEGTTDSPGYNERLDHLRLFRGGYQGFVVMCKAVDTQANPRAIESFNSRDVFRLGEIIEVQGDEWAELIERLPVRSFK